MEERVNEMEMLVQKVESYFNTTYELARLKLLKVSISVVTSLISSFSVAFVFTLCVVVFSIGGALMLGEYLGKTYYGFFVVSGFYLLAGIIFMLFLRKWIRKPVSEMIIKQALKQ